MAGAPAPQHTSCTSSSFLPPTFRPFTIAAEAIIALPRVEPVWLDRHAGRGHARGMPERQVELVREWPGGRDRNVAGLRKLVVGESALLKLFVHFLACEP